MKDDIIQAVMDWCPWIQGDFPEELVGFPRLYDLVNYLNIPEIKVLEGGRRVGKSTLIYQVIKSILDSLHLKEHENESKSALKTQAGSKHPVVYPITKEAARKVLYINFDDEVLNQYSLKTIINNYLEYSEIEYLFVDEIQRCTDWVPYIRKAYDQKQFKQIWLTGSNSSLISQEFASLLTGRKISIHIHPLSFQEYLGFNQLHELTLPVSKALEISIKKHFNTYLSLGAFPAIALRNTLQRELLNNYFEDFIYKDIVPRYEVNPSKLKNLGLYLATNASKLISYRNVAAALGFHADTVADYLCYFKEIFMFDECYKFDFSLKSQMTYDKKIYGLDTGLCNAVSFKFSEDEGRQLENLVYNALKRSCSEIYFHKKVKECDFIIKENLTIIQAIQVTKSIDDPDTKQREMNGLIEAMETYNLNHGLLLTNDEEGEEIITHNDKSYKIMIIPIWKWLLRESKN